MTAIRGRRFLVVLLSTLAAVFAGAGAAQGVPTEPVRPVVLVHGSRRRRTTARALVESARPAGSGVRTSRPCGATSLRGVRPTRGGSPRPAIGSNARWDARSSSPVPCVADVLRVALH